MMRITQFNNLWEQINSPFSHDLFVFFQKELVPADYSRLDPEHKLIYRFVRTLFSAAQLTAECAIVTLVRDL